MKQKKKYYPLLALNNFKNGIVGVKKVQNLWFHFVKLNLLQHILVRKNKNVHEEKIIAADPEYSKFKRDILKMKLNIKSKIKDTQIPFESHCYKVLSKLSVKSSSLFDHLNYRFTKMAVCRLMDHDYVKENQTFNANLTFPDTKKLTTIKYNINCVMERTIYTIPKNNIVCTFGNSTYTKSTKENDIPEKTINNKNILTSPENNFLSSQHICNCIQQHIKENTSEINVNIQNIYPNDPSEYANYKNVEQNSDAWLNIRKNKIIGSRLPALLGVYGKKKFESYWKIVKEGLNESDLFNNCFRNICRGHQFEKEALLFFRNQSLSNATPCGFFTLTEDETYG